MSVDPDQDWVDPVAARALAKQVAYDRLATGPRSRADLAQAMAKKKVPDDVAAEVLDKLEDTGLVDDAEFARSWISGRQRGKGLASRALAMELRRKGVDDEIVREAIDEIDPDVERQAAHQMVQRKLRSVAGLAPDVQTRRLVGMLARKGYSPGLAFDVVRTELNAEAPPLESM